MKLSFVFLILSNDNFQCLNSVRVSSVLLFLPFNPLLILLFLLLFLLPFLLLPLFLFTDQLFSKARHIRVSKTLARHVRRVRHVRH